MDSIGRNKVLLTGCGPKLKQALYNSLHQSGFHGISAISDMTRCLHRLENEEVDWLWCHFDENSSPNLLQLLELQQRTPALREKKITAVISSDQRLYLNRAFELGLHSFIEYQVSANGINQVDNQVYELLQWEQECADQPGMVTARSLVKLLHLQGYHQDGVDFCYRLVNENPHSQSALQLLATAQGVCGQESLQAQTSIQASMVSSFYDFENPANLLGGFDPAQQPVMIISEDEQRSKHLQEELLLFGFTSRVLKDPQAIDLATPFILVDLFENATAKLEATHSRLGLEAGRLAVAGWLQGDYTITKPWDALLGLTTTISGQITRRKLAEMLVRLRYASYGAGELYAFCCRSLLEEDRAKSALLIKTFKSRPHSPTWAHHSLDALDALRHQRPETALVSCCKMLEFGGPTEFGFALLGYAACRIGAFKQADRCFVNTPPKIPLPSIGALMQPTSNGTSAAAPLQNCVGRAGLFLIAIHLNQQKAAMLAGRIDTCLHQQLNMLNQMPDTQGPLAPDLCSQLGASFAHLQMLQDAKLVLHHALPIATGKQKERIFNQLNQLNQCQAYRRLYHSPWQNQPTTEKLNDAFAGIIGYPLAKHCLHTSLYRNTQNSADVNYLAHNQLIFRPSETYTMEGQQWIHRVL